ncbi:MAG: hypothetical protein JG718_15480 [Candidatus Thiothrix moscowensis]|nr:hypothetical protein [Candidatus Thiothrix moscowensis]
MIHHPLFRAVLGAGLLASIPAHADSWVVTQTVNVTNAVTMNQTNATGSKQAMNAINLGNGTLSNSSQTVTAGNGVTMNQSGGSDSKQAMNMILSTGTVSNTTQTVHMGSKALTLNQSGSNNHQAANMMEATTITGGSQTVNGLTDLTLETSGSDNIQAVNMASATDMGGLSQSATANGSIQFKLTDCARCYQAANYMNTDNITANMTQLFTAGSVDYSGNSGTNTGSVQAGNILIRRTGGTVAEGAGVTQSFSASTITIDHNSTATPGTSTGTGSVYAANYFALKNTP